MFVGSLFSLPPCINLQMTPPAQGQVAPTDLFLLFRVVVPPTGRDDFTRFVGEGWDIFMTITLAVY